ncbi:gastric inhibitory polypeptide receptor isoform X3 [Mirounga angustirostris]|uniref:gastric inhibitory polypeptide receptor isoform X3 n=1 Tax=Mirounga angustirostris TaxID=9716 RepID=UPI00313B172B
MPRRPHDAEPSALAAATATLVVGAAAPEGGGSVGQTAEELYQRWERYRRECQETLEALDPPAGLACNASFDMYVCWDYAAPNDTARASCPWYLPWHRHVATGFVLRQCGSDGQWGSWRDHSQCENPEKNGVFQDQKLILERMQVMYTVGYSLSLATLLLALLILSFFRRLRCTRNYIHINLFTSSMLRAAAILTRDRLLPPPGPYPGDQAPVLWNLDLAACRMAQIVTQYCVGANYTWLLVEGVYLHSLLVLVGGSEGGHFRCYLLLGWGAPAFFVIPWVIVRYLYENTQCWERNDVKAIWWIIRTPILMTILINFLIFIRILGILVSKLRTRQLRCPDYRLRASWSASCIASSTRRCSRRSVAAGTAVACATASGKSSASRPSAPPGPCPRAQAPAGSPLTAACPWGPSQGLGTRPAGSRKVTARQRGSCVHSRSHVFIESLLCTRPSVEGAGETGVRWEGGNKVPVLLEFTVHNWGGGSKDRTSR